GPEGADVAQAADLAGGFDQIGEARFAVAVDDQAQRPDASRPEVGEEVPAAGRRSQLVAAGDESAGHRVAERMIAVTHGIDEREAGRRRVALGMRPFPARPAEVAPARARGLVVDFLERALTDVADDERARAAERRVVEAPPPGIAQADVPDLGTRAEPVAGLKWIRQRNAEALGVVVGDAHVDSEHLAEKGREGLRVVAWIVA